MTTRVVHCQHERFDVYIGRPRPGNKVAPFGNPYPMVDRRAAHLSDAARRATALEQFRVYFLLRIERDPGYKKMVLALRNKVLGCFCKPLACHGDIIAKWVDSQVQDGG